jgi:hypothetical protein
MGWIAEDETRESFINGNLMKRVFVHTIPVPARPVFVHTLMVEKKTLRVQWLDGEVEDYEGEAARDLWIALGLADPVEVNEVVAKLHTPFGDKALF